MTRIVARVLGRWCCSKGWLSWLASLLINIHLTATDGLVSDRLFFGLMTCVKFLHSQDTWFYLLAGPCHKLADSMLISPLIA